MRKSLIFLAILLALSLGVIVSAVTVMDARHEQIAITETTLYGDPTAAKGLEISTRTHLDHRLFWDTTYSVCAEPLPETVFSYSDERIYEQYEPEGNFDLSPTGLNCGMSGLIEDMENLENIHGGYFDTQSPMLTKMVKDVASRTGPGEERNETVFLADYYEYFPMGYHFMAKDGYSYRENEFSLWNYLNGYFRIPVPEDLQMEVAISKNEGGLVYNIDYFESAKEDAAYMECYAPSVVRKDGVFFGIFGNRDFSQIEGGYGLYYMPVKWEEAKDFVAHNRYGSGPEYAYLLEQCENIYPMDPADCQAGTLVLSEDEAQVYAFTMEQGELVLTVFDGSTREVLQQLHPGISQIPTVWCQDNVVALVTGDEAWENFFLQVYLVENGKLELWLDTQMYHEGEDVAFWYMDAELCFDGQRFAMVQYGDNWNVASHWVQVFDRSGLQYAGKFHHSGDDLFDRLQTWDNGLQIRWK